ncbi:MAG: DNA primase [Kiritimatiellae bacterium]|nr:DNA primase [Kiritimatiellia bacterium]
MGITESVIEEIKARIDLADLIASYGIQVKHAGGSAKACCPFHHEKTPSFNINAAKGFYHCFGCGESGDAIKFVQKQEGLTFVEAVKKLAEQCGVKIEETEDPNAGRRKRLYALMAELAAFYRRCLLQAKEGELARNYLKDRALDGAVAEDWGIGYAPNGIANIMRWAEKYKYTSEELEAAGVIKAPTRPGDSGYHRFAGRLMFPVRDKQGRVVAFSGRQLVAQKNSGKYVNSPETLIFKKSNVLFGFDRASRAIGKDSHCEVIVCEGQIDCIRLHSSGFANAVAGQGTAFTDEHVRMLKRVASQAVLVYDDDAAGHKATIRSAGMLLAAEIPVRVVSLPDGDDPDSFLRTKGAEQFRALLEKGESIISFQCRVERAKERNPASIDAVARVSKAVLATIAACSSAVLRASMVGEASKLLGLPSAALTEELEAVRKKMAATPRHPAPAVQESPADEYDADSQLSTLNSQLSIPSAADAAEAAPPPPREMAFMQFLMANERDKTLDGMIGDFLPQEVFAHGFTWRFVETWRMETASGEDAFAAFAASLAGQERAWLDAVLVEVGKTQSSTLSATDIMQEFVKLFWEAHLKQVRGTLPAAGDKESVQLRMRLTTDIKNLKEKRWAIVKDIIRDFRQHKEK